MVLNFGDKGSGIERFQSDQQRPVTLNSHHETPSTLDAADGASKGGLGEWQRFSHVVGLRCRASHFRVYNPYGFANRVIGAVVTVYPQPPKNWLHPSGPSPLQKSLNRSADNSV